MDSSPTPRTGRRLLNFNLDNPDLKHLATMLGKSVAVKERVVTKDPKEKGIRKALNFGHTFGHAFESFSLIHKKESGKTPILHGYAVAYGLICEALSLFAQAGLPHGEDASGGAVYP